MPSKSAKKKKNSKKQSPKLRTKNLSWEDQAKNILDQIQKKSKAGRSSLVVFSRNGDRVFETGSVGNKFDFTSAGALISALEGVKRELNQLLTAKADMVSFGDGKNSYWIKNLEDWIVLGVRVPASSQLEMLYRHLKKRKLGREADGNAAEALDGLSSAALDAVFTNRDT